MEQNQPPIVGTAEEFLEKLRSALRKDGDFPASARIVAELRRLVGDPNTTAAQVTEVVLREPSLGPRILHLVNSSFYRRAKPIMTVSHAVVQIGMKPLAELCAGLVLVQRFVTLARKGGTFATCLQRSLVTSLVAGSISEPIPGASPGAKADETGYLAGLIAELGTLLLAYYFPQVYEAAAKRSEQRRLPLEKSIQEITGLSPLALSKEVVVALDLPPLYRDALDAAESAIVGPSTESPKSRGLLPEQIIARKFGRTIAASRTVSEAVVGGRSKGQLDSVIQTLTTKLSFDEKALTSILGALPSAFKDHCTSLDLQLPALPEFLASYQEGANSFKANSEHDSFAQFVEEIRAAVDSGEPTASVVTTAMETLAFSLGFERVVLLLVGAGRRSLVGRMALGQLTDVDPRSIERALTQRPDPHAPDLQAFIQSKPIFAGDPLFPNGWPLLAVPVGFAPRTIGVIYADRVDKEEPLSSREQAAVGVLAELLDRSVQSSGRQGGV